MSYARFGCDGSNVYVFLSCGDPRGWLECCACHIISDADEPFPRFTADTTEAMVIHLRAHEDAGDCVPRYVFDELLTDAAANDEWIRTGDDRVLSAPDITEAP